NRIAAVASTGPIHLAGWSLGGVIAHAVAHSLTRSGRDVTLSILDSYPSSDSDQPAELSVSELLAGLAMPAGSKTVETFEEAAELLEQTLGAGIGIEAEHLARISRGYSHSVELTNRHQPPVHVGAIEFFVAGRSTENGHDVAEWRRFVEGDIRVTEVDCEHNQMIEPGPAATIAVRLREVIAQWGV
ncbi:thioesterase domain-containing protein, partial [Rhodococcus sp. no. 34]